MRVSLAGLLLLALACGPKNTTAPEAPGGAAAPTCPECPTCETPDATTASLDPEEPEPPETLDVEAIDTYLEAHAARPGQVGMSVAVMKDGEIVFARGYGTRAVAKDDPVTPDTTFAIASISKQFTCAAALLLAEDGKLKMSDAVAKYYPKLTRAKDVTLLDALHHTAGYRDYYPLDFTSARQNEPIEGDALIAEYGSMPLDFDPRTRWSYSNTGYVIVGRVIERRSGKSYGAFLEQRLFDPNGLEHTYAREAELRAEAAHGHGAFALGEPEPYPAEGLGWMLGSGSLWSTPSDLLRWDLALHGGKVLSKKSYATMVTPATLEDGRSTGYACGLGIAHEQGETIVRHSGAVNGYLSMNMFVPRTRSGVAVVVNSLAADPGAVAKGLLDTVIRAGQPDRPVPEIEGPPADEVAKSLLSAMQNGTLPRAKLSPEYSAFATDERLQAAAPALEALGEPITVEVLRTRERGGMEAAVVQFVFATTTLQAVMFRRPDGIVEQFLLRR